MLRLFAPGSVAKNRKEGAEDRKVFVALRAFFAALCATFSNAFIT